MDSGDRGHPGGAARLRRALVSRHVLLEGRGADRVAAVGRLRSRGVSASRSAVMVALSALLPVLALTAQSPLMDSIRTLARDGPDSALVGRTRHRPDDALEALRQFLSTAGSGEDSAGVAALTVAERLASAWTVAWHDSFYVRKFSHFR